MRKRCVIVGGANINDYEPIRKRFRNGDFFIFCDSGLRHQPGLKVEPSLIVGDFDSHARPNTEIETIVLPCEKDDTDTIFAVKEAIKRGFDSFLLVGVIGQRFDHTMGNISVLFMLDACGKEVVALDDYSELSVVSKEAAYVDDSYSYFSLLNMTGTARGITIKHAKYPLENAEITCDYQYGISNEVLPGKTAEIIIAEGKALLVKVR